MPATSSTDTSRVAPAWLVRGRAHFGPLVGTAVLPFALVLYLALKGGGYDSVVRSEVGIAVWWILLLGAIVGVMPLRSLSRAAWTAIGIFAVFTIWSTAALGWTESDERTVIEVARTATYLGVLVLALATQGRDGVRRTVCSVGFALALIGALALMSRLHPSWFPANDAGAAFDLRSRLNYPVNYWNGLATLMAMGIPLMLAVSLDARRTITQAMAAAAIPVMALTAYYTLSRGGAIEVGCGLLTFAFLYPRRLQSLPTLLLTTLGSVLVILAATQRDALEDGLTTQAALDQGDSMLVLVLVVSVGVALCRAALALAERYELLPSARVGRRSTLMAVAFVTAVAAVSAVAVGVPGELSDRWEEFKQPIGVKEDSSSARFESARGNGRYQFWQSAVDAGEREPVTGIGPGTYEYFWAREGSRPGFVRDAHSLFLEAFAELGIPGLLLILGLVAGIVAYAIRRASVSDINRPWLAAAAAAAVAFTISAAIDWTWELAVVPVCFLLLAAAVLGDVQKVVQRQSRSGRTVLIGLSALALIVIAIPLAGASAVRTSQSHVNANDLDQALDSARNGADIEPWAASPHLQEALVLELRGEAEAAAAAARAATDDEPTNWRTWLVLSRIEAFRGNADEAVAAYRRARSLNPRSALFTQ